MEEKREWGWLMALVLPLIALLPTLGEGVVAGADVEVHIHRIYALSLALQDGVLWPRWISYLHLGYGYPIFNFYAPGYAYITALLELSGFHITTAYNLVQSGAWLFGSVGMYLLARRFLPVPAALLSVVLWAYAPSRLYEVWWQGSLAQIVAASFIPYLLLGVIKSAAKPSLRGSLAIALPFAALILSHTPMMYISALYAAALAFLAPIWITKGQWRQIIERWVVIGGGFLLGIGLAAIFLLPTLLELRYVLISNGVDGTTNYLLEQFLPLSEIFTLPRLIDATDMYLDFPRTLGLIGGVLSLIGIIALWRRKRYGLLLLAVLGLAFTLFMLVDESLALWLGIPGFANLRFPARLLRIGAVLVALLGGASVLLLPRRWQVVASAAGIALVIAQILPIIRPYEHWLNWDEISALDEIEHELEDRTWGTVSYDEFNPIWGERIFLDAPEYQERYVDEPFHLRVFERDIAATNWQGLQDENLSDNTLLVTTDEDRAVRFRQYYFPGWVATVNGMESQIYPDEQIGLITLDLPAGEHVVTLEYRGTTVQRIATAISIISLIVCLLLYRKGRATQQSLHGVGLSLQNAALLALVFVAIAALNQYFVRPWVWLQHQSPAADPRYMQTAVDAVFGDEVVLLGYTLYGEQIGHDDPLRIDLYWRAPDGTETNYQPLVQLLNLTQSAAWAVSNPLQSAAGETSNYAPDRFARDPHTLRLNDAVPPFVGRISVQLIGPDGAALTLDNGRDRLVLEPLIPIDAAAASVPNRLNYQIGDVATLHCATIRYVDDVYTIDLGWGLVGTAEQELVVLVHGLDADGDIMTQADGAPFNGDYPAVAWRGGQMIFERRTLPYEPDVAQIALGLYTRATVERLPVRRAGLPVADDRILLNLDEASCSQ